MLSLTFAHRDWPGLVGTAPPAAPAADRVLRTAAGCHEDAPGRSVSSTGEAASAAPSNAAAPPGAPKEGTPDDPAPGNRKVGRT